MLFDWLKTFFTGRPHFYIGGRDNPYMLRWFIVPRNPWLNVYLHKFLRDDDDRAMHDHPWWFVSIMLRGEYREQRPECGGERLRWRRAPSIAFRRATDRHRVELAKDASGRPIPCWTLVITGRKVREWGFHCPKGFVVWHEFVEQSDHGNTGKGCG